jgi:chromosome segregation ATPase
MAKQRAPRWQQINTTIDAAIDTARSELETLRDEYQEWFDNLPEQFQSGDKGEQLETAIEQIEEVIDKLDGCSTDVANMFPNVENKCAVTQPQRPKSTWLSRRLRGEDAIAYAESAKAALEAIRDEDEREDDDSKPDYDSVIDDLDDAIESFNDIEWVAMR